MKLLEFLKKKFKKKNKHREEYADSGYPESASIIRSISHTQVGYLHKYDVTIAARGYYWGTVCRWADYIAEHDLEQISQVIVIPFDMQEKDITTSYINSDKKCVKTPELKNDMQGLSFEGISKTIKSPMKIIWFNQTNILRFITLIDDDSLIRKYIETVICCTFGTKNAMKLGQTLSVS